MKPAIKRRDLFSLLALVGVAGGASLWLRQTAPIGRDVSRNHAAQTVLRDEAWPQGGPSDANLTVVVFTDYQCPACRRAEPALREAMERDGQVRIIYRDWPIFGPRSTLAARAALAASYQGKYELFHRALMAEPWVLDDATVRTVAASAGVSVPRLERDLATHRDEITAALARTRRDAFLLGVSGTPGYLIGALLVDGAQSASRFTSAFREARRLQITG
ncbi:MAG: DsbA family protein [Candidatus Sphingomonas colombiensis]|nr:DsbA family protein [Sphingomonas sp.]WEK43098.1 MAG: DsbA family protein [Sphingomonas sp.]